MEQRQNQNNNVNNNNNYYYSNHNVNNNMNNNMNNNVNNRINNGYQQGYDMGYNTGFDSGYNAAMNVQMQGRFVGKETRKVAIVIKSLLIGGMAWLLMWLFIIAFYGIMEDTQSGTGDILEYCDRYYYEMDYMELAQVLSLYNTMGDEFDKYWEAMDGYNLYMECVQWQACVDKGIAGAQSELDSRISELKNMAVDAKDNENRTRFNDLIEELENIGL